MLEGGDISKKTTPEHNQLMSDLQELKKQLTTFVKSSTSETSLKEQQTIIKELQQLEQELIDNTAGEGSKEYNNNSIHDKLLNLKEQCKHIIPLLGGSDYNLIAKEADRGRAHESTLLEDTVRQSMDYFSWMPGYQRLAKNALK